ncbi:hypothetical protein [Cyanobium sp. AMD-g]|uniref:hypothetical protein n=1 Tax=Cyanobium sp. AMD-g TaxID=2823699 RepID=UPI0020CF9195|nr:hypothetical protein [Cyanobium sp. AMD-g]
MPVSPSATTSISNGFRLRPGPRRLQAADGQQQARRQQAERDLQELRTQRAKLEKQVDGERIQLTVNQLTAKGDSDQASKLQTLWAMPCPNLQAARWPGHQIWWCPR